AVHGTLNEMPPAGLDVLDVWEGVAAGHYERRTVRVMRADTGETIDAVTYVALLVSEGLRPTRDYLGHLLAGRDLLPQKILGVAQGHSHIRLSWSTGPTSPRPASSLSGFASRAPCGRARRAGPARGRFPAHPPRARS